MLDIVPITLAEANAFVEQHHRHHKPVVGHKFSIGCTDGDKIVGVSIVGRPVSRHLDDGLTLEVNRLCTDGTHNACSMLYAASWRAARAMGYKKLITYILDTESGTSLKAAGWKCVGQAGGLRWTGKRRAQPDNAPLTPEELRGMDGKPVWVETMQEWRMVYIGIENDVRLYTIFNTISARHVLDNGGQIYRRKPEPEGGATDV